ncbi:MAG: hypothetical protein WCS56_04040 [Bacilli bacterium]
MPGIVMHHHFGRVVYSALPTDIKNKINNINLYDFATNGPDPFMLTGYGKVKKAKYTALAETMHNVNTQAFLINLVNRCRLNYDLFPYLCGFITHYYLDAITNPYIFYKTGIYNPEIDNTIKYRGLTKRMILDMDSYVIETYYGSNPNRFNVNTKLLKLKKIPASIHLDVNNLYKEIYNEDNGAIIVNKSIKHQKLYYSAILNPIGFMNRLLSNINGKTNKNELNNKSRYSTSFDVRKFDIFNFKHNVWSEPVNGEMRSIKSFFDLLDDSKTITIKCLESLYEYIFNDSQTIDLKDIIKDISYYTGYPCSSNKKMSYFDIVFK